LTSGEKDSLVWNHDVEGPLANYSGRNLKGVKTVHERRLKGDAWEGVKDEGLEKPRAEFSGKRRQRQKNGPVLKTR